MIYLWGSVERKIMDSEMAWVMIELVTAFLLNMFTTEESLPSSNSHLNIKLKGKEIGNSQ